MKKKRSGGTGGEDFLAGIQIALLRELIPSRWRQDEIKKFADIFFSVAESVRFGRGRGMEIYFHRGGGGGNAGKTSREVERPRVLAETSSSGSFPSGCKRR